MRAFCHHPFGWERGKVAPFEYAKLQHRRAFQAESARRGAPNGDPRLLNRPCARIRTAMASPILHRRSRFTLWLAAIAILFAALSPTINAWRAQGQPKLFAELCTSMGFVRVAVDDSGTPAKEVKHSPECAWCLAPGSLLAMGGADRLHIPPALGREPAPQSVHQPLSLSRHHAFAWAQAPPVLS